MLLLANIIDELNPVDETTLKPGVEDGPSVIVLFTSAAGEFHQNTVEPFGELFPVNTF
jgi:hypothetical protein